MFDFILYPVSAILWFWHKVFGFVLGPDNGFAWALSVFFLVFSLRVVLLKPAISQIRSGRKMQKFAPHIQKLREKYKNDRQRMAQEMQKLQSEHGVNPLGGCLPVLLQVPVFLSLFHVLREFQPGKQSVYIFDSAGVQSFLQADIFGAKLGNWITQTEAQLADFDTSRANMMAVGIPLMIVASAATYFSMRMSQKRQTDASMSNPQTQMMAKAMLYIAPVGTLISGWFLPMAIVLYFMANNIWTLGQTHFLTNKIDREQERERQKEVEAKQDAPRPKPGQKPSQVRNGGTAVKVDTNGDSDSDAAVESDAAEPTASGGKTGGGSSRPPKGGGGGGGGGRKNQQKNRPGKQAASSKKSQKKRR